MMGCKTCKKAATSHRKGLWSPDEDQKLRDYILGHGHGCWSQVPAKAGLQRNGKSCRLRWINYLRPGLKRSVFTAEEEATVLKLHSLLGNKWSKIAVHLPGRTDNEVKNHFNTYLKKRVAKVEGPTPHTPTTKLKFHDSGTDFTEQNQFLGETNSQISLSESSDSLESFAAGMNQFRPPQTTFHRVLFADWLQMFSESDHQSSISSMDGGVNCQQESTSSSEGLSDELLPLDMLSTHHPFINLKRNISEGFQQQQQMVFAPEEVVPEVSFSNLLSFNEVCNDFELNYDMFIDI